MTERPRVQQPGESSLSLRTGLHDDMGLRESGGKMTWVLTTVLPAITDSTLMSRGMLVPDPFWIACLYSAMRRDLAAGLRAP